MMGKERIVHSLHFNCDHTTITFFEAAGTEIISYPGLSKGDQCVAPAKSLA